MGTENRLILDNCIVNQIKIHKKKHDVYLIVLEIKPPLLYYIVHCICLFVLPITDREDHLISDILCKF